MTSDPTPGSRPFLGISWSWSPCRRTLTRLLVLTLGDAQILRRGHPERRSTPSLKHRTGKGSVTVEDRETLRTQDIVAAVVDACVAKHMPIQL